MMFERPLEDEWETVKGRQGGEEKGTRRFQIEKITLWGQSIKQVDLKQRKPSGLEKGVREVCGMQGTGRR